MKESGIDLSFDEMDQTGSQKQSPAVIVSVRTTAGLSSSLTMPGTLSSKPFNSITKPTIRLRSDFKLKLAKQKMEDDERRRRQASAAGGVLSTMAQSALSSSLNESSRASPGLLPTTNSPNYSMFRSSNNEHTVAHTAPAHYFILSASPNASGLSQPVPSIGIQDGRRSVTSQLSGCDEIASTATSLSEIDDMMSGDLLANSFCVESCDSKDFDIEALNELLPHATLGSGSCIDSSQMDAKQALQHCASYPNMTARPPGYRGGRLKEPPPKNMKDMTDEELAQYKKERQKKDTHNEIEKRRRQKINEYIQVLGSMLPSTYDIDFQNKKGAILEGTVKYLKYLLDQEREMNRLLEVEEQLTAENRRLLLSIQEYQVILNATAQPVQPTEEHIVIAPVQDEINMSAFDLDSRSGEFIADELNAVHFNTTPLEPNMCDRGLADFEHCLEDDPMFSMPVFGFESHNMATDSSMYETISDDFLHSFN